MSLEFTTGRYDNLSLEQYHRECKGWSKSALDKVNRSMAHYLESCRNPPEPTHAQALGSAFHCRVLTPELYESQYAIEPILDKRTKAGKEMFADFQAENMGKTLISAGDAALVEQMASSVLCHPVASQLLTDGDAEHSFFWTDPKTNLPCKCRPDYLRRDGIVIDLKKTVDASWFAFQRSIVNYRYHVQGAFFCDGVSHVTKELYNSFILIAVEDKPPFAIGIYRLESEALNVGRTAYEMDLAKVVEYEKDKSWAGYPVYIQDMFLPAWVN
jgi:hypothetical protein